MCSSADVESLDFGSKVRADFIALASLHQPMDIFEPPTYDAVKMAELIFDRIERMLTTTDHGSYFYQHLFFTMADLLKSNGSVIFHGGIMRNTEPVRDIDLLLFQSAPFLPQFKCVQECHSSALLDGCEGESELFGFFVANTLLILHPTEEIIRLITSMREELAANPFLQGGLGELVLYAAYKILKNMEFGLLEPAERGMVESLRFDLTFRKPRRDSDYGDEPITTLQLNAQIREQMQQLPDPNLEVLTRAAIRRMRVREERRKEFARRFVQELKSNPVQSGAWHRRHCR